MSTRTETPTTRPAVDGVKGARILIVESRFYADIADALISGAEREIKKNGAACERVVVPGAFEIPGAIALAAGRYDGFWELGLKRWDMAAGILLIREAGGFVTDPGGKDPRDSGDVVAANPHLHPALSEAVIEGVARSHHVDE